MSGCSDGMLCPECNEEQRDTPVAEGSGRQFWLSFVDTSKSAPEGEQQPGGGGFLGVCIVKAESAMEAVQIAWKKGLNPGGEVAIADLGMYEYPPERMNRLLTADEALGL